MLDIVAFVAMGDFPRSRLGEKQRGKVLGNWVGRKMHTIAQFSIRDPDAEGSVSTVGPEDGLGRRGSAQSGHAGGSLTRGAQGSSLRHVESLTNMPVAEEPSQMEDEEMMREAQNSGAYSERSESRSDVTPTNEFPRPLPMQLNTTMDYSLVDRRAYDSPAQVRHKESPEEYRMRASYGGPPEAYNPFEHPESHGPQELEGTVGGLRVANRDRVNSIQSDDWEQEALRSMNLGR